MSAGAIAILWMLSILMAGAIALDQVGSIYGVALVAVAYVIYGLLP